MNKYCFIVFFFISKFCFGQNINFSDANFKNKLLSSSQTNGIAYDCINLDYYKIDVNNDNEISYQEAEAVCSLFIPSSNITNLSGIEHFTNLKLLQCSQNNIINLDVMQLQNLEQLACNQNQINNLNVSNLNNLWLVLCNNNQITSLDFSNNPNLTSVYCGNNNISSLDFTNNPIFNDLGCKNNPNLTTIKIKNNTTQLFGNQTLYNECWTGLPNLTTICADDNEIPALQNYLAGCGININNITINSSCALSNNEFVNNNVIIYPNPAKNTFTIQLKNSEKIISIAIYNILGQLVQNNIENKNIIDISNLKPGNYIVKVQSDFGNYNAKLIKE